MEAILTSIVQAVLYFLNLEVIMLVVAGVLLGLTIGVIPGLGGLATLALLLPFAYGMDPVPALALILGAYSALYFGGSITAILLNTPGTGEQVVTTFDGYKMTQQGKGARALGASATSSALGGLIGVFVMIAAIPFVRLFMIYIRPPEMFALGLLGVATIGVLSAGSVTKGLLSGLFGLMLSFVGYDPITGTPRFTFGNLDLFDGLGITSMTLGLFAIAEMFHLFAKGRSIVQKGDFSLSAQAGSSVWDGVKDAFRHFRTVVEGGVIGAGAGMIPGLGGTVAMFFSYARAKQRSPNPHEFGQGAVAGVIAPEAANNAKEGGSLVPTIAFGVPGSSGMAIFIGIFLILGFEPGPNLISEHLDIVLFMALTIAGSSLMASLIGLLIAPYIARASYVRPQVIVPTLITISFLGGFLDSRVFMAVTITLVAGLCGFWFNLLNYSNAGIILGFLMGPLVERYLFLSLQAYGGQFFLRPISLAILMAGLAVIFVPYFGRRAEGKVLPPEGENQ